MTAMRGLNFDLLNARLRRHGLRLVDGAPHHFRLRHLMSRFRPCPCQQLRLYAYGAQLEAFLPLHFIVASQGYYLFHLPDYDDITLAALPYRFRLECLCVPLRCAPRSS